MSKTAITSPELAPPVGPFSQAIEVGGFLYFSGQVAQDPATGKVVEGGIVPETERVFRNLSAVLKAAGKWNTFEILADGRHLTVTLNGTKTADVRNGLHEEGCPSSNALRQLAV